MPGTEIFVRLYNILRGGGLITASSVTKHKHIHLFYIFNENIMYFPVDILLLCPAVNYAHIICVPLRKCGSVFFILIIHVQKQSKVY